MDSTLDFLMVSTGSEDSSEGTDIALVLVRERDRPLESAKIKQLIR